MRCDECGTEKYPTTIKVLDDEHTVLRCACFEPISDDQATAGPMPNGARLSRRAARHDEAKERTLRAVKAHGPNIDTASPGLRAAAVTHFGSWTIACQHAGLWGVDRLPVLD